VPELWRFGVQRGKRIDRRRVPAVLRGALDQGRGARPGPSGTERGIAARGVLMTGREQGSNGELAAAISNSVVQALARTTGRGPTRAKTTLGDNGVFVVLQDSLTVGERTLTDAGQGRAVLDLRRRWQGVMQEDITREIEELTGRKVVGFMSDNHVDPDLAVEVFILEPLSEARG
jgi:uncharacterized protein YbcI